MAEYSKEEIKRIEEKWRNTWQEKGVYKVSNDSPKPKYYVLDMFPYPSGAGLHVGHPLGYIASDIVSRYKRLKGFNVLHPMGFDAFGLPAEQYAIQTGQHPAVTTEKNIKTYIEQLGKLGFCYDWDRKVETADPGYYKWTQWIFMQLFNAWYNKKSEVGGQKLEDGRTEPIATLISELEKNGNKNIDAVCDEDTPLITAEEWKNFNEKEKENFLQKYRIAYQSETMVNWCAALGTVLSNDEVKDGVSERGGYPVERMKMLQWSMRISAYAERLLKGLDVIDWPEPLKEMQRNWIGKSKGCELEFIVDSSLTPNPSPGERGFQTSEKKYWHILKEFSKENRKNPTPEESVLWEEVRNNKLGHKIRRQHTIGIFIGDFVCLDKRIVIEVDGGYHIGNKEYDNARTEFLNSEGFSVIRFLNSEIKENLQKVLSQLKSALDNAPSIKTSPSLKEKGAGDEAIKVFTTRIDTIFGATFLVLAPEHELVEKITTDAQRTEVSQYVDIAKNRSERERMSEVKRVSGAFTGAYAINPFNNERIPIWIADYVLAGYGTGAVMAVPGHDERDHRFAKQFKLPIVQVVEGPSVEEEAFVSWDANIINSGFMNGMTVEQAIDAGIQKVEAWGIGKGKVNYRMRDAIFGRQRYWGEPFPVYFKDGLPKLVDEKDLPITLPEIDQYKPTETGEPPLARAKNWNYKGSPFELTTMPGWAGSSWYWFRYMDPHNENEFCSKEIQSYWKDVDLYIGGSEHATGHLLYSRFWCKALKDLGFVDAEEPFKKLINQGHIQGVSAFTLGIGGLSIEGTDTRIEIPQLIFISKNLIEKALNNDLDILLPLLKKHNPNYDFSNIKIKLSNSGVVFRHVPIELVSSVDVLDIDKFLEWRKSWAGDEKFEFILEDDGKYICQREVEKMSKSKFNVVNPDDIVNNYGADTLRMYEMFLGPLEQSKPWNTNGIDGVFKFLRRFWNLFHDNAGNFKINTDAPSRDELKVLHKTLKKVEQDIDNFSFNTSVSEFMICANELSSMKCNKRAVLEPLVIALAPFAPHIAEELWEKLGYTTTILEGTFPKYDPQYLIESSFSYPISINGKVRAQMEFALDMPKEDIEKVVLASEIVQKWTEGKPPKKVIVVQGRIVNVVL